MFENNKKNLWKEKEDKSIMKTKRKVNKKKEGVKSINVYVKKVKCDT